MERLKIEVEKEWIEAFLYGIENRNTAIILYHGFTGSSSGVFLPQLAEELSERYLTCRFDFRGQGISGGDFYKSSITRELEDSDHVVRFIRQQYSPKNIVLLAHSFGAAIAILYAAENDVQGLISVSGEGDLKKAISYEFTEEQMKDFEERGKTLVVNWSKRPKIKDLLGRQFLDDMMKYSTIEAGKKIRCPVLFIHGKNDNIIPHVATEEMFEVVKSPKEVQYIEGADHGYNVFLENSKVDEMSSYIKDWLNRNF
jgi:alpha-beta hydrolase superfamily lysophospholipase